MRRRRERGMGKLDSDIWYTSQIDIDNIIKKWFDKC